jgi:hypothetical protein
MRQFVVYVDAKVGIRGYIASISSPRRNGYEKWKSVVRWLANLRGCPDVATKHEKPHLHVQVYWKGEARIDTVNVYKACEDALFAQDRAILAGSFDATERNKVDAIEIRYTVEKYAGRK